MLHPLKKSLDHYEQLKRMDDLLKEEERQKAKVNNSSHILSWYIHYIRVGSTVLISGGCNRGISFLNT